jgi:hypothetical protein
VSPLKIKIPSKNMREKPTNTPVIHSVFNYVAIATHHVTKHKNPIHNILSTAPQLNISQKALGTLPEYGNVMPKHVGATIHNY